MITFKMLCYHFTLYNKTGVFSGMEYKTNIFRNRKFGIVILLLTLLVNTIYPFPTIAGKEMRTVKVGYMNDYGVSKESGDELPSGYVYEYLVEVSKIANWQLEFIPVAWSEGLNKLEKGEIDLLGPLQHTKERGENFTYPRYDIGYEYGMFYTKEENEELYHDDFKNFNGLKVGTISDDYFFEGFKNYAKENNFSVQYVIYDENQTLLNGLNSGEVDAIVIGSNANVKNGKIIGLFEVAPVHMVTTKGNIDISRELNHAIKTLKLQDIYFDARMYNKYYQKHFGQVAITREMNEYLKNKPKLRVVYDPDYAPLEYYDKKTKKFKGINADLLEIISQESGIDFEYIKTNSYEESISYIEEGKADLLAGYVEKVDNKSFTTTSAYNKVPVAIIKKVDVDDKEILKIAIPKGYDSTIDSVKRRYKDADIIIYNNVNDCIEAVEKDVVDASLVNTYLFDNLARSSDFHDFKVIGVSEIVLDMRIGVSNQTDKIVKSILNRSIEKITQEQIDVSVFANTVDEAYDIPWQKVVKEYSFQLIFLISLFFLIIIILIIYNKKKMVKKLEKIAYTDQLTGTRNLEKFKIDAAMLLENNKSEDYSVLYMDIGKFKNINDSLGFKAGNEVLIYIVKCFTEVLQDEEILGRVSADYFILLVKDVEHKRLPERLKRVFEKIQSFNLEQLKANKIILHCGIYKVKKNEEDIIQMIDKANEARKTLKGGIENAYKYYTTEMHNRFMKEKLIEESMETALKNDEFLLYLQPKYDLTSNSIAGAEALVRWNHSKEGVIPPIDFIPIFERNGFIVSLDFYIYERVCQKIREWIDSGYNPLPVSVNVSRIQIGRQEFTSQLIEIVKRYNIPPHLIELEITETTFMDNIELLVQVIKELKQEGFQVSMDDFGTGYSSLDLLKVLPVDILKLDKTFLEKDELTFREKILVENVIHMAHLLEIKVVAEGVETVEQVEYLKSLGCDLAQGYYFGKPMIVQDLEEIVFSEN